MAEQDMTHNQALQEIARFENIWVAASKLKEALQVAASLEASVRRLQSEEKNLQEAVGRSRASADDAIEKAREEVANAKADSDARLRALEVHEVKRSSAYAETLAKKEREVKASIASLEEGLTTKREDVKEATESLDREIADKQSLISGLNEQLDKLRKRLG